MNNLKVIISSTNLLKDFNRKRASLFMFVIIFFMIALWGIYFAVTYFASNATPFFLGYLVFMTVVFSLMLFVIAIPYFIASTIHFTEVLFEPEDKDTRHYQGFLEKLKEAINVRELKWSQIQIICNSQKEGIHFL